jgi:hypothetical protein
MMLRLKAGPWYLLWIQQIHPQCKKRLHDIFTYVSQKFGKEISQ